MDNNSRNLEKENVFLLQQISQLSADKARLLAIIDDIIEQSKEDAIDDKAN